MKYRDKDERAISNETQIETLKQKKKQNKKKL